MEIEDIRDDEMLERWLQDQPREFGLAIAHRSTMRVAFLTFVASDEPWKTADDQLPLAVSRLSLSTGIIRKIPDLRIKRLLVSTQSFPTDPAFQTIFSTYGLAAFPNTPANMGRLVAEAVFSADNYADARFQFYEQVREDARLLLSGEDLHTTPLWSIPHPDWFTAADTEGRAIWAKEPEVWDFWVRWWDGVLAGKPLPWDLQEQVALIPNEDWEKGPAHIAGVIRGIEELFDLRQMVKGIKAEFPKAAIDKSISATLEHRSHNNPPEMVETPQELLNSLSQIWAEVDVADQELAKTAPDRAVLRAVGARLLGIAKACALYVAGLGDKILQSAAEELGKEATKWLVRTAALSVILKFAEKLIAIAF